MTQEVRITLSVAQVLKVFLEDPARPRYGFEIMRTTGLKSGSLYPILARLERAGWLESKREDIDPTIEGRPARKLYSISTKGTTSARQELAILSEQIRPPQQISSPSLRSQGGWA